MKEEIEYNLQASEVETDFNDEQVVAAPPYGGIGRRPTWNHSRPTGKFSKFLIWRRSPIPSSSPQN